MLMNLKHQELKEELQLEMKKKEITLLPHKKIR
jgi:hypothetical protein